MTAVLANQFHLQLWATIAARVNMTYIILIATLACITNLLCMVSISLAAE